MSTRRFRLLCGNCLPHTAQDKPGGALDPLVPPGFLQGGVQHHGRHGGELQDLLLVPHRDPQKLERLAAVAHGFLLPPLPVGLSVLGVVFGDIVFNERIQVVPLGQVEITLQDILDCLSDREFGITGRKAGISSRYNTRPLPDT